MTQRFSRREMLKLSGALAAGSLLAACAPQPAAEPEEAAPEEAAPEEEAPEEEAPEEEAPEEAAPPEEEVTLRYWHRWGTPNIIAEWQESEVYKEMTMGLSVEMLDQVTLEKFSTGAASGDLADVVSFFDYVNWFRKGLVIPLTAQIDASSEVDTDDILGAIHEASRVEGELLAVPGIECYNRYGLNIDTSLVEQAGLDPDPSNFPVTLEEVYEWHEQITAFDDAGNLLLMGMDPYGEMAGQLQALVTWWPAVCMGVDTYDNDTGEYHFDDPKIAEYVKWSTKFYDLMGPDNVAGFRDSFGQWGQAINAQKVAMTINGYWQTGQVTQEVPEVAAKIEPTWPPVPEERRGVKIAHPSPHFISVSSLSEYPEEGFRLIEYIFSHDSCDIIYKNKGWLTSRRSHVETIDGSVYHGLQWWLDTATEATEFPVVTQDPLTEYNRQQWLVFREKIYRYEMEVEEALAEWQRLATEEYDKQFG